MKKRFDCLIIGGGHNGLVAAAYLAKSGKSVCVLERRHVLGGCSVTEELWPGFKISVASYVISLFRPEIIRELRLKQYGLKILPRNPSSFTPLLDGRSLLMGPDERATCREIAKFSKRDAERYPAYNRLLERVAGLLEPILAKAAPDPLPLPAEWRKIGIGKRLRDTGRLMEMYQALSGLGGELPDAIELLIGAARPILERWFEAEVLRATLATDAVIGAFASPSYPGTAYVLLHHVMGEAGGARGVWGYVQGGMGGLATALAKACHDLGVEIRRESPVKRILDRQGPGRRRRALATTRSSKRRSSPRASTPIRRSSGCSIRPSCRPSFARPSPRSTTPRPRRRSTWPSPSRRNFTCLPSSGVGPAPSRHDPHQPDARLHRAGLRRRQVRLAQHRADPGNHAPYQRRFHARPGRAARDEHLRAVRPLQAGRRPALGRHQGRFRRSLHRAARPLRPERARRDPASADSHARSIWNGPVGLTGGNIMQGAMTPQPALLAAPRRRLGRPSHADPRPLPVRRRQPSRRRRPRRLRPQCRRGDSPQWVNRRMFPPRLD